MFSGEVRLGRAGMITKGVLLGSLGEDHIDKVGRW